MTTKYHVYSFQTFLAWTGVETYSDLRKRSVELWRTALDNAGLSHLPTPRIARAQFEWFVDIEVDTLEGRHEELEAELVKQLNLKLFNYLVIDAYGECKTDEEDELISSKHYGGHRWGGP